MAGEKNSYKNEATRQMEEMWDKRHDPVEQERERLKKNRLKRAERVKRDAGL